MNGGGSLSTLGSSPTCDRRRVHRSLAPGGPAGRRPSGRVRSDPLANARRDLLGAGAGPGARVPWGNGAPQALLARAPAILGRHRPRPGSSRPDRRSHKGPTRAPRPDPRGFRVRAQSDQPHGRLPIPVRDSADAAPTAHGRDQHGEPFSVLGQHQRLFRMASHGSPGTPTS